MSKGLGKKLWKKIEAAQGNAYIADSVVLNSDVAVYMEVKARIGQARKVVEILEKFLEEDCKGLEEEDRRVNGPNHWERADEIAKLRDRDNP